ncbi:MAG TPA: phosphoglyceromutase [Sphingobacteriaceae bacterium]
MMKKMILLVLAAFLSGTARPQTQTENMIIITTDGYRWQELFNGVDTVIANHKSFNQDSKNYIYEKYWDRDPLVSRSKILPFFWNTLAPQGQVYGNRNVGNNVDVANPFNVSFPGYSELLTGFVDTAINSNAFENNPNENILEFLNKQKTFNGRVAAFGAWAAFPYILSTDRNDLPVFAAFDHIGGKTPTPNEALIDAMLQNSHRPWGNAECLDVFTHYGAFEYLKTKKPKVLYISYGETDEWAHSGRYRFYLDAAHQFDKFVKEIWTWIQSDPDYKNRTTLLITVDHGRGDKNKRLWTSHGSSIPESSQTWIAAIGPDIKPKGEVKTKLQLYQKQIAATIASFLNVRFKPKHPVSKRIKELFE